MSDGTETLDLNTPDIPASGEVETSSLPADTNAHEEVHDLDGLEPEGPAGAETNDPEEEFEEVERNGKKYRIPKALSGELMMQQDYTKKTQTVAEERKALEARAAEIAQQAERIKQIDDGRKKVILADATLERYEKINWQQLEQDDPLEAGRRWREYQQWKDYKGKLEISINESEQSMALDEERKTATRVQEVMGEVRKIPGWSDDIGKKVEAHAIANGMDLAELNKAIIKQGAPFVRLLHKAYLADQLIQQKQTAAKTPAVAQEPVKPLAPVATRGASPAARKSLDAMSMEEYAAARKAGRAV